MAKKACRYRWVLKRGHHPGAVYVASVWDGLFFYATTQREARRFRSRGLATAALDRRNREVVERNIVETSFPGSIRVVRLKLKEKA